MTSAAGEQWQCQDVPAPEPSSSSPAPAKGPQSPSEGPHPPKQPLGGETNVFAQSHILTAVVGGTVAVAGLLFIILLLTIFVFRMRKAEERMLEGAQRRQGREDFIAMF